MDYKIDPTTDATAPVQAAPLGMPSAIEDLEKRLAVLKSAGVREYQDGPIHIMFERQQRREESDPVSKLIREYEAQLVGSNG